MLRKVTKTAPGRDSILYWLFRHCSYELAEIVTHIFNCTLRSGTAPSQWLTAVTTPVPKISAPYTLSDFRTVSVTPILCQTVEKLVVLRWLRPAITEDLISDQFAF
jgi:hypothetical protein